MESSFTLTDGIFQWITPAFNKKTIDYLNHLLHVYKDVLTSFTVENVNKNEQYSTEISVYHEVNGGLNICDNDDDDDGNGYADENGDGDDVTELFSNHQKEDLAFSVNWSRLMKIPEIVILQGFKPLHVPTQHHLCCSLTNYTPVHSFPFDNNFCNKSLRELSTANTNAEEILSNPRIRQHNVLLYDSKTERVLCLLTSVRLVFFFFFTCYLKFVLTILLLLLYCSLAFPVEHRSSAVLFCWFHDCP
ncbi:unnamed protein product [Trichobilharzia regenti]|nr:unnamed protein product [Trichobilharzia regenti]